MLLLKKLLNKDDDSVQITTAPTAVSQFKGWMLIVGALVATARAFVYFTRSKADDALVEVIASKFGK